MSNVLRRLQLLRNLITRQRPKPSKIIEEKWVANFSKEKHTRFDIKSESSFDANLRKNVFYSGHSLVLGLKKERCIAWVEASAFQYRDMVCSGTIRIDARGGYGAGGILFRKLDDDTYYSFLISNRSYFRLDVIRNGMPFPLVAWTELPLSTGELLGADQAVDFSIITNGNRIIILIRGRWVAELTDASILEGSLCFAAASYEVGDPAYRVIQVQDTENISYTTEVFLESFSVDSRLTEVSALYEKWWASSDIDSSARLKLAETFTAMNQHNAAMGQIRKSWDMPEHRKTQAELLLAGRLAQQLNFMADAEQYISQCFQMDLNSPEGKAAMTEMAKILYTGERYKELVDYCLEAVKVHTDDPVLFTLQGHGYWNIEDHKHAALAYDRAFELDRKNGIPAKNAANVYDVMGRKKEALKRYLEAGRVFLSSGNYTDLGLLVPKLCSFGENNWEARSLVGKWAFAVEDWKMAAEEFSRAKELRKVMKPKPPMDGAQVFLEALLLVRAGRQRDALPLLEEAVALEKKYALFRFRLAETLFLLDDDPDNPRMLEEMNAALALSEKESADGEITPVAVNDGLKGWIHNFAAQVALKNEDLDLAAKHLEKAAKVLGDLPAVMVNRGLLLFLQGSLDEALELLTTQDDPEGVMANAAGNLLVRSGRLEEADERYRKALIAAPNNIEFISNRVSCLIELSLYGEADRLLAHAHTIAPSPTLLEMISFVAVKKGEYSRAEQACRSALEMDPRHVPSLLSLGWILLTQARKEETSEIIRLLDTLELKGNTAKGLEELKTRLDELMYQTVECAWCERSWKVLKDTPPVPTIRLFAMPPDDLPAGTCAGCGKTYCISCAKNNLDPNGRFMCAACDQGLKLLNDGLKSIVYEWAAKDGLVKKKKAGAKKRTKPRKSAGPKG